MLGRFSELSIRTPDIRASLDFYARLGFTPAEVGEAWSHPYAVLTDGRLNIGLHQELEADTSVTFVKADLLRNLNALETDGVELEFRHLGNDVFNEIGWRDPSGQLIRLVEARTFSPQAQTANSESACGYFLEIGLPSEALESSKAYWEKFGFVGIDEAAAALPHVCCTSNTVNIGLYDRSDLARVSLLFNVDDRDAMLNGLASRGIEPATKLPAALSRLQASLFIAPEGTPIIVTSGAA
jgi:catechol 2,3-dioxygenase-like lactoylglutathione lyase family enzyme